MGEDRGSWLPQQHFYWLPPNLNCSSTLPKLEQQNNFSAYMHSCTNVAAKTGVLPICAFPELHLPQAGQVNEPPGWFYCLPRFRQAVAPAANSGFKEKLFNGTSENDKETLTGNVGSRLDHKRLLVFDQTGDHTTLIFNSGIGAPVHCPTSWTRKPPSAYNWKGEEQGFKRNPLDHSGPILTDEFNNNHEIDVQSEMHEDTEELNALLYSDDDSDSSEYDEISSTGHSPSTMTNDDKQFWFEGIIEEVGSSDEPTKRQKVLHADYEVPSVSDTTSFVKHRSSVYEDDAESSCANGKNHVFQKNGSMLGKKRTRKESIGETVGILQSLIPGGKGKDAIVVLDEAISYLKSLKLKAEALGLNSL